MRAAVVVFAVCSFAVGLWANATAEPTITIYTDGSTYQFGDTIEVSLSAENDHEGMAVDLYVGIILPDGDIWSTQYDGWRHCIEPWIPSIYVPAWFEMTRTPFWSFDLPRVAPPISGSGQYYFAALLTYPGTFDYVSIASLAPFSYQAGPSTDITMVSIPAGSFLMGSPEDEPGRDSDEGPQRTVNVSAFEMSETEITEKQWEDIMGWSSSCYKRGDNCPTEYVTWFDCASFCNELSEADGLTKCYTITNIGYSGNNIATAQVTCDFEADGYRLPTEAEWEYACRAGTTTRYYTGDSDSDLGRAGWYSVNSSSQKQEVGQKEASAWGLYDMHGNVWEWCWDWYDEQYYGTQPDPDSDPMGPDSGTDRVVRGGSFYFGAEFCRSADRSNFVPNSVGYCVGFRVVRSVN